MQTSTIIRVATVEDTETILNIYTPYVESSAITFEYDVPSLEEFRHRIQTTLQRYPYLVAEQNGVICGYAYASPFKTRAAYDWSVETTIYLAPNSKGAGIGRLLYSKLEQCLKAQNIVNLNACITPASPPYVDATSELFHAKLGYKKVAHFTRCGYKFERWFDVIWMEKFINQHQAKPAPFTPFSQLSMAYIEQLLR